MTAPLRVVPGAGDGIVWEDPPAARSKRGATNKWVTILTPLMDRPGQWARMAVRDSAGLAANQAANLRRNIRIPAGRWEFTSRKIDERRHGVYARYLGPDDAA